MYDERLEAKLNVVRILHLFGAVESSCLLMLMLVIIPFGLQDERESSGASCDLSLTLDNKVVGRAKQSDQDCQRE